jgi:hypothetical protein
VEPFPGGGQGRESREREGEPRQSGEKGAPAPDGAPVQAEKEGKKGRRERREEGLPQERHALVRETAECEPEPRADRRVSQEERGKEGRRRLRRFGFPHKLMRFSTM